MTPDMIGSWVVVVFGALVAAALGGALLAAMVAIWVGLVRWIREAK